MCLLYEVWSGVVQVVLRLQPAQSAAHCGGDYTFMGLKPRGSQHQPHSH